MQKIKDLKHFPLGATAFPIESLKEKSVYKETKDFPLSQLWSNNNAGNGIYSLVI